MSSAGELEEIGNVILSVEAMLIREVVSRSLTECDPNSKGKQVQQVKGGKEENGTVTSRGGIGRGEIELKILQAYRSVCQWVIKGVQ